MSPPQPASPTATSSPAAAPPPLARPASHERFADASWETWSTSVVLRLTDPRALGAARVAVEQELEAIDRTCSRFRRDSEIARVNASAGRAVRVGPLLAEALALALRTAALTDGDVDPTVGSALVLVGYDRDWRQLDPPAVDPRSEQSSIRESGPVPTVVARAVCGWRNVTFDRVARTVRVPAGFTIDLGATAKAWAADRAAQAAALAGGCGALVGIGGDIAVSGPAPARGWAVHVTDDHRSDHHAPGQTVTIRSGGLATSSTAVRRWSHRGRTMHHIIDPATGAPVRGAWRTVSVAAASCADANIATTFALVRASMAPAWLARLGVPARLVSNTGRVYTIGAWPAGAVRARTAPDAPRPSASPRSDAPRSDALQPGAPRPRAASSDIPHADVPQPVPPQPTTASAR
jgi:thiamine biosynthesis lipoprotein